MRKIKDMVYQKFRVRTPVKSFRDLEVYQEATKLSAAIFNLKIPAKYKANEDVLKEIRTLKDISKMIPKLIVESYGDKFTNMMLADKKLEVACQAANMVVAKLDFLNALLESEEFRGQLSEILKKYQRTKMRILNLKRAWSRVFGKQK